MQSQQRFLQRACRAGWSQGCHHIPNWPEQSKTPVQPCRNRSLQLRQQTASCVAGPLADCRAGSQAEGWGAAEQCHGPLPAHLVIRQRLGVALHGLGVAHDPRPAEPGVHGQGQQATGQHHCRGAQRQHNSKLHRRAASQTALALAWAGLLRSEGGPPERWSSRRVSSVARCAAREHVSAGGATSRVRGNRLSLHVALRQQVIAAWPPWAACESSGRGGPPWG